MKDLIVKPKFVIIYNHFAEPEMNEFLENFAQELVNKGVSVKFQNIQGYKSNERVPNARAVALISGIGDKDLHKKIKADYEADKVPVYIFQKSMQGAIKILTEPEESKKPEKPNDSKKNEGK